MGTGCLGPRQRYQPCTLPGPRAGPLTPPWPSTCRRGCMMLQASLSSSSSSAPVIKLSRRGCACCFKCTVSLTPLVGSLLSLDEDSEAQTCGALWLWLPGWEGPNLTCPIPIQRHWFYTGQCPQTSTTSLGPLPIPQDAHHCTWMNSVPGDSSHRGLRMSSSRTELPLLARLEPRLKPR